MLTSMTGYGRREISLAAAGRAVAEVRTLNHRFLEIETRLPDGFQSLEESVRLAARRALRRGQVRISVSVRGNDGPSAVQFRAETARRYAAQLKRLKQQAGLSGEVTLQMVLGLPQVMAVTQGSEISAAQGRRIQRAVEEALAQAARMRLREGARLKAALTKLLRQTRDLQGKIRRRMPEVQQQMQERLAGRIEAALKAAAPGQPVERSVILNEAVSVVQGTDVSEELARIDSHLSALDQVMQGRGGGFGPKGEQGSPGRTMDFLAQELQREINTLGTKLRDGPIARWVVALKGQTEKLREQAANLE